MQNLSEETTKNKRLLDSGKVYTTCSRLVAARAEETVEERKQHTVKLLQQANGREEELQRSVYHWHKVYDQVKHEYLASKYGDVCQSCQEQRTGTSDSKTYTLCKECSETRRDLKKEVKVFTQQAQYWQECCKMLL